jgi:hypothetical protein
MARDPLAVARDLACLPRGARSAGLRCAIRCPCPLACDPLAVAPLPPCLRSGVIRWPIRRHPMADPASSDGRSGVIRWPIRRHPMADPASSDGRSGVIRWPIRWPIRRHPMADPAIIRWPIRWPIRRHPLADPMADPASSAGRSDGRSGVIRCLRCD